MTGGESLLNSVAVATIIAGDRTRVGIEGTRPLLVWAASFLSERLDQRAETLSGGEQQMLAIARALMTRASSADA
jgi:ABC-type branched-subunit amino acid transport system ATPase component